MGGRKEGSKEGKRKKEIKTKQIKVGRSRHVAGENKNLRMNSQTL